MAETGIETVSIADAATKLRDKIHSAFAELLPPEQWQKLIEVELQKFLKPTKVRDSYSSREVEQPSLLQRMCEEEFKKHIKSLVVTELMKPEYQANAYQGEVSTAIQKWLTDNAQQLIQATVLELAGVSAQSLLNRMRP